MSFRKISLLLSLLLFIPLVVYGNNIGTTPPVVDDPLLRMPGTQPGHVNLEGAANCMGCHANYDTAVDPGSHWQGSMMAQAARDFLFFSAMTVAAQDSNWAIGSPNATDLCIRCHFPKGWLEGRSDPTNASLMTGADYDGVQCDVCHRMYDPFYATTYDGTREGSDWLNYWDETNLSPTQAQAAAAETYLADQTEAASVLLFNNDPFFQKDLPVGANYTENTSGQYFVSENYAKRGPFADAYEFHNTQYSRLHKSKYMCGTCHDVSNPVLANMGQDGTSPLTTETESAFNYAHIERTFSEFMLSDYGQQGGTEGIGPYAPNLFNTSHTDNVIATCQDCHMRDVVGRGAAPTVAVTRPDESSEHPQSGQPLHDLTGGNTWVPYILASATLGSPNYDATNAQLLNQGAITLTLDLSQGLGINAPALLAGIERAKDNLHAAAVITDGTYDASDGSLTFKVQNQTGHKLISGFPEGRRMFVNIKAYDNSNSLIYEANPYDDIVGTLKGLPNSLSSPALGVNEVYIDELVYEVHHSSSLTGELETFHVALADNRYKDNRIPPKGFDSSSAAGRLVQPRWAGADALSYFTAAEYAGGYDEINMTIPSDTKRVEVELYYQVTSREYIEFLRDEINGTQNLTLPSEAYIAQTDPFFSQLKAWGDTIWDLWLHNKDIDGAKPFLMTQAVIVDMGDEDVPVPPMVAIEALNSSNLELSWPDVNKDIADNTIQVNSYTVYRSNNPYFNPTAGDQLSLLNEPFLHVVQSPDNGALGSAMDNYFYVVTALNSAGESAVSNRTGEFDFDIQPGS